MNKTSKLNLVKFLKRTKDTKNLRKKTSNKLGSLVPETSTIRCIQINISKFRKLCKKWR